MAEHGSVEKTISATGCARCGGDHADLSVKPLTNAPDEWDHWAMCPTLGEPIWVQYRPFGVAQAISALSSWLSGETEEAPYVEIGVEKSDAKR